MKVKSLLLVLLAFTSLSQAASGVKVTFNQTDCAFVDHWELLRAEITSAKPSPSPNDAVVFSLIPNQPPTACGFGIQATITVPSVGNARWWLRAVTASNFSSFESTGVDRLIPLAVPTVIDVMAVP